MGNRRILALTVACMTAAVVLTLGPAAGATKAGDLTTARQGALVASDFPTGWSGTRAKPTPDAKVIKLAKTIPSCSDYVKMRTTTAKLPAARSLDFADGQGTKASNVVNVFSNTKQAGATMKLWSSAKMPACLEKFTQAAAGTGVTVVVEPVDVSSLSPDAIGYTAKIAGADNIVQEALLSFAVPVGKYVSVFTVDVSSANAVLDPVDTAVQASLGRLDDAVKA